MSETIEPADYVAYGGLNSIVSLLGITMSLLLDGLREHHRAKIDACRIMCEFMLNTLETAVAISEKGADAQRQITVCVQMCQDYARAAMAGDAIERAAMIRELEETLGIVTIAFIRFGQRLGIHL